LVEAYLRIEILRKMTGLMEGKREHLGLQIACESGKPLTDGQRENLLIACSSPISSHALSPGAPMDCGNERPGTRF
jgi:hypothetical protein